MSMIISYGKHARTKLTKFVKNYGYKTTTNLKPNCSHFQLSHVVAVYISVCIHRHKANANTCSYPRYTKMFMNLLVIEAQSNTCYYALLELAAVQIGNLYYNHQ